MGEGEMRTIAGLIGAAVRADPQTEGGARVLRELAEESRALVDRFPAYDRQDVFA
jgi:glycine hydroxymethyltransferase